MSLCYTCKLAERVEKAYCRACAQMHQRNRRKGIRLGPCRDRRRAPGVLTAAEKPVLLCMLRGLNTKQIARELGLAIQTVKHHRAHMLKHTRSRTSGQLCYWAALNGYRAPNPPEQSAHGLIPQRSDPAAATAAGGAA